MQQPGTFCNFLSSLGLTFGDSDSVISSVVATSVLGGGGGPKLRSRAGRRGKSGLRTTPQHSVLSKLNPDDVSFNDAVDFDENDLDDHQHSTSTNPGEIDILWGDHAWWKPSMLAAGFDRVVDVSEWDEELTKLSKAAVSPSLQSALSGALRIVDVALIGHFVGTKEANAFILTCIATELSNTINYGFMETLGKVLPYAIDNDVDHGCAGRYLDTSVMLYVLGSIVQVFLLWVYATEPLTLWFGFDLETAELAKNFIFSQAILECVGGLNYWLHLVLDGKLCLNSKIFSKSDQRQVAYDLGCISLTLFCDFSNKSWTVCCFFDDDI